MRIINLTAKFEDTDSLKEIFAEVIRELEEGTKSNYDGITDFEDFTYNTDIVSNDYSLPFLEK